MKPEEIQYDVNKIYEFVRELDAITRKTGLTLVVGEGGGIAIISAHMNREVAQRLWWVRTKNHHSVEYTTQVSGD